MAGVSYSRVWLFAQECFSRASFLCKPLLWYSKARNPRENRGVLPNIRNIIGRCLGVRIGNLSLI